MNFYDIVIIAVIVGFAMQGLWRGFFSEVFEAVGFLLGLVAAWQLGPSLAVKLPPASSALLLRLIIASILIFAAIYVSVALLGSLLKKTLDHGPVTILDRIMGTAAGALKGFALIVALAIIFSFTGWGQRLIARGQNSRMMQLTLRISRPLGEHYRESLAPALKSRLSQLAPVIVQEVLRQSAPPQEDSHRIASSPTDSAGSQISLPLSLASLPQTLKFDLNKMSPQAEAQVQKVLNDPALAGFGLSDQFNNLRHSGLSYIEIDLADLSPEGRAFAESSLSKARLNTDSLVAEKLAQAVRGVDLGRVRDLLKETHP